VINANSMIKFLVAELRNVPFIPVSSPQCYRDDLPLSKFAILHE